ncbi:MAG: penicillin-binding protein activator [Alphaproteobacteria bacterium]
MTSFTRLSFLLITTLFLSACQTGGGYNKAPVRHGNTHGNTWDYNKRSQAKRPAENAPKTITDTRIQQTTQTTQTAPTPPTRPVKVSILLPLSGKHEALGQSMLKAAQLALFDINASGFELIPHDTSGTPDGARHAAQKAIQNGSELILGPLFADSVRAAKPIASNARINMLAFSTDWTLAGGNTFIMGFLPFDQVDRLTKYIAAKRLGRVGVIAPDTPYGNAVNNAYSQTAARYGIRTTARTLIPPHTSNLAPTLSEFTRYTARQSGAPKPFDAVLMPTGGQQAADIANLLSHYDLPPREVKRLGTGLFDDKSLASEANLNGAWFAAPMPDLRRNFEQKYIATYGKSAPRLASLAYDATALAAVLSVRGITATGTPAFDKTSIANPNGFAGIDGIFRFRTDNTIERGLAILEFKNGHISTIDPAPRTFQ